MKEGKTICVRGAFMGDKIECMQQDEGGAHLETGKHKPPCGKNCE